MSSGSRPFAEGAEGPEFAPGRVLGGKYQIERVIGGGGMGVILLARHTELNQRVAIKALRPDALKEPEMVARFTREARALARLKSEHVARVIDVGKEGQSPFMVMEYLKGKDLSELQKERGRLTIDDAITFLLQAMEALAEAHQLGIVHRDIKPANLFLTTHTDGSPLIKLLDFGISKVAQASGGLSDDALTNTSMIMGSLHYMPPEQLKDARTVDNRADIWALGVVLYRLLTGEHVFAAPTTAELCAFILMRAHSSLESRLPGAPAGLSNVIDRCLEKDRGARYAIVAELALVLEPFAPRGARISVERIVRMSQSGPAASVPPPSFPPNEVSPVLENATRLLDAPLPHVTSLTSTESIQRSAGIARKGVGVGLLLGIAAVVLLGIGVAVAIGLRLHKVTPTALVEPPRAVPANAAASIPPPDPATEPSATTAPGTAVAAPRDVPSSVGAAVSARPSAGASGSARPKGTAAAHASPRPPASPATAPAPAANPDPNDFGGRK